MLRRLRPLLFWLLIATLPLKGLATVVWAGCEPVADAPHAHHVVKTTTDTGVHPQQHPHADRHHHGNPSAHAPVSLELFGGLAELNLSAPAGASADTDETSSHCHHGAPCCTLVAPARLATGSSEWFAERCFSRASNARVSLQTGIDSCPGSRDPIPGCTPTSAICPHRLRRT